MKPEFDRRDPESETGENFHRSPAEAIPTLLSVERQTLRRYSCIAELSCGDGALVVPLRARGFHVIAADFIDRGCPDAQVRDFLAPETTGYVASLGRAACVMNPPFNKADEFVIRACELFDYVALILRLRYLGPQHFVAANGTREISGRPVWTQTRIPLARVIIPARRWPMMHRDGYDGPKQNGGMTDSCWFIWEKGHTGPFWGIREPDAEILRRVINS